MADLRTQHPAQPSSPRGPASISSNGSSMSGGRPEQDRSHRKRPGGSITSIACTECRRARAKVRLLFPKMLLLEETVSSDPPIPSNVHVPQPAATSLGSIVTYMVYRSRSPPC
jgi:hypothetical protein